MRPFLRCYVFLLSLFISVQAAALAPPLPVDEAFSFRLQAQDATHAIAHWAIAPGYHLYRERISIELAPQQEVLLQTVSYPKGVAKHDDIQGNYQAYFNSIEVPLIFQSASLSPVHLVVKYQGCADQGFCYAPVTRMYVLAMKKDAVGEKEALQVAPPRAEPSENNAPLFFLQSFTGFSFILFYVAGLLLAFTPCVLPMVPILSAIILQQHKPLTLKKSFGLSFSYVLAMALTYTALGVGIAHLGHYGQILFQTPIVIGISALMLLIFAVLLWQGYDLHLPRGLQEKITKISQSHEGHGYLGVMIMGALSTLIVSPCVTAPLASILLYIAQTGDVWFGGMSLFLLGLGMGTPLLIFGTLGGRFLPKAGAWMDRVRRLFAILLALVGLSLGIRIMPVDKLPFLQNTHPMQSSSSTVTVDNEVSLAQALAAAQKMHQPVLLDFYADWCVSCRILEHTVFSKPEVQAVLKSWQVIRVNLTADTSERNVLMKQWQVFAPPTFILLNGNGKETARLIGEFEQAVLLEKIKAAK